MYSIYVKGAMDRLRQPCGTSFLIAERERPREGEREREREREAQDSESRTCNSVRGLQTSITCRFNRSETSHAIRYGLNTELL